MSEEEESFPVLSLRSPGSDSEALPGLHPTVLHSQPVSVAEAAPSDHLLMSCRPKLGP